MLRKWTERIIYEGVLNRSGNYECLWKNIFTGRVELIEHFNSYADSQQQAKSLFIEDKSIV